MGIVARNGRNFFKSKFRIIQKSQSLRSLIAQIGFTKNLSGKKILKITTLLNHNFKLFWTISNFFGTLKLFLVNMVSVLRNASYFVRLNSPSRSGLLDLRTTIRAWEDKDLNRDFSNLDQLMHSNLWIDVQFKLSWRSESERQIRQRARRC